MTTISHAVRDTALNHHIVVWSIRTDEATYEYTWNHSTTVQMWRVLDGTTTRTLTAFGSRTLLAEMPCASPNGDWGTIADARMTAIMHAAQNIPVPTRTLAGITNYEQA